jgi:hypothetical protein
MRFHFDVPAQPGLPVPKAMTEKPDLILAALGSTPAEEPSLPVGRTAASGRLATGSRNSGMDVRTLHFTTAELHFATAEHAMYIPHCVKYMARARRQLRER